MSQSAQFRGNYGCPLNPQGATLRNAYPAGVALPSALRALTAELASSEVAMNSERAQVRASVPLVKSITSIQRL